MVFLPACRSSSDSAIKRSAEYKRQGNSYQAYWEIAEALEATPGDEYLERLFWERRLEYLLDQGRDLIFEEREFEGIAELEKALALDAGNRVAIYWINKAREKLAKTAVKEGEEARRTGDLEKALEFYAQAMIYVPDFRPALDGQKKVNEYYQDRYESASKHYTKGSRARGEQLHRQSKYHNGIAEEQDPSLTRAAERKREAAQQIARERYDRAKEMEEKGFYGAALMEYQAIALALPDAPGIKERIAEMDNEVKALGKCREAEMLMRKMEFDKAQELFNEAYELGRAQRPDINGMLADNRRRRFEQRYRKAKDLELEYRFEDALKAYKAIDKEWKKGFLDVKTRVGYLESAISEAGKAMRAGETAEKAGEIKKAIDLYEEALSVYPGYKGLGARVKALKAKMQTP